MINKSRPAALPPEELFRKIAENKKQYHRRQARLPIEEKLRILIELQKIELAIRPHRGDRDHRLVWPL
jgi:hypothetical protein